jgi:hypothetical protein
MQKAKGKCQKAKSEKRNSRPKNKTVLGHNSARFREGGSRTAKAMQKAKGKCQKAKVKGETLARRT